MNLFNTQLILPFKNKKVIKIISGLNNLNIKEIIRIAKAAEISKASYIDIVANTKIVAILKDLTSIPICVSSISPIELYNCVLVGADLVEIGNFDFFYKQNINLSINQVLQLAKETRSLIKNKDICVTIPHTFSLYEQQYLSKQLEILGVNILQTEGPKYNNNNIENINDKVLKSINKAVFSLCSTYILSKTVNIPIISASNLDSISSLISISCGASGIGIGSNIKKYKTIYEISKYIDEISYILNNHKILIRQNNISVSIYKEIINIILFKNIYFQ